MGCNLLLWQRYAIHVTTILLGFLLIVLPARAQDAKVITIKFSHVVAADTPKGQAAERFRQLAQQFTEGRVRVEVYPNSTLYRDKEEVEALHLGAVQMIAPSLSKLGQIGLKEFEAFDLPYLFEDQAAVDRVTKGEIGKELLRKLETRGLIGLAFWDNGFKVFSANRPITTPEMLKGLRMRIQASHVLAAQMRTLGALPQVMAFSETYRALQSGLVEGSENPPSNLYTQRMHELQPYVVNTKHGYLGYAVVTNKKFWDSLPADIRLALSKAMAQATEYGNKIAQTQNDEALNKIEKSGLSKVVQLSADQQAVWRRALEPTYASTEARLGQEFSRRIVLAARKP
jgi:C4-dicarboxylate-binding protein DctP